MKSGAYYIRMAQKNLIGEGMESDVCGKYGKTLF